MTRRKAAEILASALECDAEAQEQGRVDEVGVQLESVLREIQMFNDIPRPIFKLASRFWKEWAQSSRDDWRHNGRIFENDWPGMARVIAQNVRTGTMPQDKSIIENFVRKPSVLSWPKLKTLLSRQG